MTTQSQPKKHVSISIRFPVELHQALKKVAASHHRSFNGEVLYTLICHVEDHARRRGYVNVNLPMREEDDDE